MNELDLRLTDALVYPLPRPAFSTGLLQELRRGGVTDASLAEFGRRDPRWAVLGAVGAAGAACLVIYRRHHYRKGAA